MDVNAFNHRADRIHGCLLGTAIGDGLGLPYEGLSPRRARRMLGPPDRYRFCFGRGMVSDDTDHAIMTAIALLQSITPPLTKSSVTASVFDLSQFECELARQLKWWLASIPAGVGLATLRSILKLWMGWSPANSGVFSAGNGPAMRAPILGAMIDDVNVLKAFVRCSTRITHSDPKAEYGALIVAFAAHLAARDKLITGRRFLDVISEHVPSDAAELMTLLTKCVESVESGQTTPEFAGHLAWRTALRDTCITRFRSAFTRGCRFRRTLNPPSAASSNAAAMRIQQPRSPAAFSELPSAPARSPEHFRSDWKADFPVGLPSENPPCCLLRSTQQSSLQNIDAASHHCATSSSFFPSSCSTAFVASFRHTDVVPPDSAFAQRTLHREFTPVAAFKKPRRGRSPQFQSNSLEGRRSVHYHLPSDATPARRCSPLCLQGSSTMLNRLSQQMRSLFSRPTRRRRANFGSSERLEPRELLTTVVELVEDLQSQPKGIDASSLKMVEANGFRFFAVETMEHGTEVWRTDGTSAGTIRLTNLPIQPGDSAIRGLAAFRDRAYFFADDGIHGMELWATDGTVEATHLVSDLEPGKASSFISFNPEPEMVVAGSHLYFMASTKSSGRQIYRTDGTSEGTVKVTSLDSNTTVYFSDIAWFKEALYFRRLTRFAAAEIWKLDTQSGELRHINPSQPDIRITSEFLSFGDRIWFTERRNGGLSDRFWEVHENGLEEVLTLPPGEGQLGFNSHFVSNGKLFSSYSRVGSPSSQGLWVTDGTAEGSQVLVSDYTSSLVEHDGQVYFLKNGEFWHTDGTASGTGPVGVEGLFADLVADSGRLFLTRIEQQIYQKRLWVSDGTSAGTRELQSFLSVQLIPGSLPSSTSTAFPFLAYDAVHGWELWDTNGAHTSAVLIKDLRIGTADAFPHQITSVEGDLYFLSGFSFSNSSGVPIQLQHGQSAMRVTGNSFLNSTILAGGESATYFTSNFPHEQLSRLSGNGVEVVKSFTNTRISAIQTHADNVFFFVAQGPEAGLWYSNGTESGTTRIKPSTSQTTHFKVDPTTGRLWFYPYDVVIGRELWISDGTSEGTHLVKDVTPGVASSDILALHVANGLAYFTVEGQAWVSDGTEVGTVRLESVEAAMGIHKTDSFASINDVIYMSVFTTDRGWEVVRTQGTAETSWFVTDLSQSSSSLAGAPFNLTPFRERLLFAAWDADGLSLWTSEDTGSTRLRSFGPDIQIRNWSIAEDTLFFTTNDQLTGKQEIWASNGTAEGTRKLQQDAFDVLFIPRDARFVEYAGGIAFAAGRMSSERKSIESTQQLRQNLRQTSV